MGEPRSGQAVYAGLRDAPQANGARAHAAEFAVDLRPIEIDPQSEASIEAAVTIAVRESEREDTLVYNAGSMAFGPAEPFTPEQYAELCDVNAPGAQRLNRIALPILRRQGRRPFPAGVRWRPLSLLGRMLGQHSPSPVLSFKVNASQRTPPPPIMC